VPLERPHLFILPAFVGAAGGRSVGRSPARRAGDR
jgi:hypothetical protein